MAAANKWWRKLPGVNYLSCLLLRCNQTELLSRHPLKSKETNRNKDLGNENIPKMHPGCPADTQGQGTAAAGFSRWFIQDHTWISVCSPTQPGHSVCLGKKNKLGWVVLFPSACFPLIVSLCLFSFGCFPLLSKVTVLDFTSCRYWGKALSLCQGILG